MARAATRSNGPGNPLLNQYLKCMGEIPLLKRDEVEVADYRPKRATQIAKEAINAGSS